MSAANRGASRSDLDFYETPEWAVRQLLGREPLGPAVIDPGCGTGAILRHLPITAYGVEIDPARRRIAQESGGHFVSELDFLANGYARGCFDAAVMNPPYSLAREFVLRALEVVKDDGKVCALLRLNFLGSSRKRFDVVGPGSGLIRVWALSKRPSFTGQGTDACDYAWVVWRKGYKGAATVEVMPMPEVGAA